MTETIDIEAAPGEWGLLAHIPLRLSVEIGAVSRSMRELLDLRAGSVVELERAVGDPVDVLANGAVIARGEVVAAGDRYGVRITEIVGGDAAPARRERRR